MSQLPPRKCPCCGLGTLTAQARPGRFSTYKGKHLELPATLSLTECSSCHDMMLDDKESDAFSDAVDALYAQAISDDATRS